MTSSKYSRRQLHLSSDQVHKLASGNKVKLHPTKLWSKKGPKCNCDLTAQQIKKIRKSMLKQSGTTLRFSPTQVKHHLKAGGIWSTIKNKVSSLFNRGPRDGATGRFMDFVNKHGADKIIRITVGRKPVQKGVQLFLNVVSLGQYEAAKKKLHYDDVYHNYMVITTANGHKFRIEKNHVVEANSTSSDGEFNIPINEPELTVGVLIGRASSGDPDFWKYDPANNNCQVFVTKVLSRNHLSIPPGAQEQLRPQDGDHLISSLGKLNKLPKFFTDLAGTADRVIHGEGIRPHYQLY